MSGPGTVHGARTGSWWRRLGTGGGFGGTGGGPGGAEVDRSTLGVVREESAEDLPAALFRPLV